MPLAETVKFDCTSAFTRAAAGRTGKTLRDTGSLESQHQRILPQLMMNLNRTQANRVLPLKPGKGRKPQSFLRASGDVFCEK